MQCGCLEWTTVLRFGLLHGGPAGHWHAGFEESYDEHAHHFKNERLASYFFLMRLEVTES